MTDKTLPSSSDDNRERISDAEALFQEPPKPAPKLKSKPRPVADLTAVGQYEIEDLPDVASTPVTGQPIVDAFSIDERPKPRPANKPSTGKATKKEREIIPEEAVEEVWSRSAEWGATIAAMAVEAVVAMAFVYFLLMMEAYGLAFLGLMAGGLGFAFLSYPMLITLERPVRITPEQAVKDYFGALSHHYPHYIRMWLLLSTAGKVSASYASFDGFRQYWKEKLANFHKGKASSFTPLKFEVHDFKAEKSAGKSVIEATFSVRVLVRGRQAEGAIETFRVEMDLVKGPDRMWYLEKGTLG